MIYLVKLIIPKAGNKKEAGLSKEEPNKEQLTREVTKESVLKNKPIGKESNNPVEFGTQQNSSASVLPPPPTIQINLPKVLRGAKKNKTGSSSGPENEVNNLIYLFDALNREIKVYLQKKKISREGDTPKQDPEKLSATPKSHEDNADRKTGEELVAKIKREQAERKRQSQFNRTDIVSVLMKRRKVIEESERSDSSLGWFTDKSEGKRKETKQKKQTKHRKKFTPSDTLSQVVKQEAKVPTMIIYLVIMKIGMRTKELSCRYLQAPN